MKQFILFITFSLMLLLSNHPLHAQQTFTVTYLTTIPFSTSVTSFYVSGNYLVCTVNETIQICDTTKTPGMCLPTAGRQGIKGDSFSLFNYPSSIQDNLYFADSGNHKIKSLQNSNALTVAGSSVGFQDAYVSNAKFNFPLGVAYEGSITYVADSGNFRIRKIENNQVTTIAGTGVNGFSGDNGNATNAKISYPYALTVKDGIVYFTDTGNLRIRRISGGIITTLAGNGQSATPNSENGNRGDATLAAVFPYTSIYVSSVHEVFFVDASGSIRVVMPNGKIYQVATIPYLNTMYWSRSTNDIYAMTSYNDVYKLVSNNRCDSNLVRIDGNCVPICKGKVFEDACGGSSRGTCGSYGACQCKVGYSGTNCEVYTPTNRSVVNSAFSYGNVSAFIMMLVAIHLLLIQ